MTPSLRAVGALLVALSLVAGTGCGGGDTKSANDYVKSINKVQTDFASSLTSTATPPSGSDAGSAARATFDKIDSGLQKVVTELKGIEPPDKVKDLHQDLIREIDALDSEVKKVADSVASGDLKVIADAQTRFATQADKLQREFSQTITSINNTLQG